MELSYAAPGGDVKGRLQPTNTNIDTCRKTKSQLSAIRYVRPYVSLDGKVLIIWY